MNLRDARLIFAARLIRLFAYGFLPVALFLYLKGRGFGDATIGLLLTLTLLGDAGVSLWLTTHADRAGRKRTLLIGAALMTIAGVVFASSDNFIILAIAAIIGVISPSGNEIGPFLSVEQAALAQLLPDSQRTRVFAWYNLVGSFATAFGALCGGLLAQMLQNNGSSTLDSYRAVVIGYASLGIALAVLFLFLSPAIEVPASIALPRHPSFFGLHGSQRVVLQL